MGLVWCIKLAASHGQINGKYVSNRPKLVHQRERMLLLKRVSEIFPQMKCHWAVKRLSVRSRKSVQAQLTNSVSGWSFAKWCPMLARSMCVSVWVCKCVCVSVINDASVMIGIVIGQNVIITALFYDCDCILPDRQINYAEEKETNERTATTATRRWGMLVRLIVDKFN